MTRRVLLLPLLLLLLAVLQPAASPSGSASEQGRLADATTQAQSGTVDQEPDQARRSRHRGMLKTRRAVEAAVRKAWRGAPLPRDTRPDLGRDLKRSKADLGRCAYQEPHDDDGGRLCPRGDRDAGRSLVLLGDSHGRHWVPALEKFADRHGWRTHYLVKSQCTPMVVRNGDAAVDRPRKPWKACQDFRSWALKQVARMDPDVVVVSTGAPTGGIFTRAGYVRGDEDRTEIRKAFQRGTARLFERLARTTDSRVVLLRDVPARKPGTAPEQCFAEPGARLRDCLSGRNSQAGRERIIQGTVRVARRKDVQVADPASFFCWRGRCPVEVGGRNILPYRNNGHITVQYAKYLAHPLARLIRLNAH